MTLRHKLKCALLFTSLLFTACLACRKPSTQEDANHILSGEPENYSATLVRLIDNGQQREEITSRVACSGEMRREEWTEAGARRALIFRPDLGKSFLLDLDNRVYVETDINPGNTTTETKKPPSKSSDNEPGSLESDAPVTANSNLQTVGGDLFVTGFEEEPTSVETQALPDEQQDGRACKVTQQKATFADGRVEVTKTFRAQSLNGLMVKTEMETVAPSQRTKLTIERRDIKLDISADEFAVPAGFKKVERLLYR
jgi:hypothetical protein